MQNRDDMEKRIDDLERHVRTLRGRVARAFGIRKRASWGIAGIPFYDIALGPDFERGEPRGHARGIIAIGDMATGVLAMGGFARGLVALGGLGVGLVSVGGLSIGLLVGAGGLGMGGVALGGGAIGGVAVGGAAAGYYACGAAAVGVHTMDVMHQDPQALAFFRGHGVSCRVR